MNLSRLIFTPFSLRSEIPPVRFSRNMYKMQVFDRGFSPDPHSSFGECENPLWPPIWPSDTPCCSLGFSKIPSRLRGIWMKILTHKPEFYLQMLALWVGKFNQYHVQKTRFLDFDSCFGVFWELFGQCKKWWHFVVFFDKIVEVKKKRGKKKTQKKCV